jgi:hypothetical protein
MIRKKPNRFGPLVKRRAVPKRFMTVARKPFKPTKADLAMLACAESLTAEVEAFNCGGGNVGEQIARLRESWMAGAIDLANRMDAFTRYLAAEYLGAAMTPTPRKPP